MAGKIIIYQVLILTILACTGFLGIRLKLIKPEMKDGLAKLVFNVTLPLLIFSRLSQLHLTVSLIRDSLWYILLVYLAFLVMYLTGRLSSRVIGMKYRTKQVFLVHSMFGNIIFLGFPLIDALFPGGEGILFVTLYHLVSSTILWTGGIYLLHKGEHSSQKTFVRNLINPNTIAFVLGLLVSASGITLPDFYYDSFGKLGDTTLYLSLLYIGMLLSTLIPSRVIKRAESYLLSFNKLIWIPMVMILILWFFQRISLFSLGETAQTVLILETAMPCMANIVILAKVFGSDDQLAMENVFITTIFSIFTLPFIHWMLMLILH